MWTSDYRPFKSLDRIEDGDRREGIASRVDDDGVRALSCRLDQVDQLALMVRLAEGEAKAETCSVMGTAFLDLGQRGRALDMRLADTPQGGVGAVSDQQSIHVGFFFLDVA